MAKPRFDFTFHDFTRLAARFLAKSAALEAASRATIADGHRALRQTPTGTIPEHEDRHKALL